MGLMGRQFYIISDMHLGHGRLTEEGFRPVGFSEKILSNLGMILNPSDILINLGDNCFGQEKVWYERLSFIECKKWLVLGNHDKHSVSWYMDHGWDMVCEGIRLKMFGRNILFSHIPVVWDGWYDVNIHGHFHSFGLDRIKKYEPEIHKILTQAHYLVNIESNGYQPMKFQTIMREWEKNVRRKTCN